MRREALFLGGPLDGKWIALRPNESCYRAVLPVPVSSWVAAEPVALMPDTIDYHRAGRWGTVDSSHEVWTPGGVTPPHRAMIDLGWPDWRRGAPARPSLAAVAYDFAAAALASLDGSPRVTLPSPDAMRLDASRAEADAELAEWRAFVEGMKGRRR